MTGRIGRLLGVRGRALLGASAWSAVAKACAAANAFASIPFAIDALTPAEFGIWATVVSLATFAGFLDFGLSNATMNLVSGAVGRDQADHASAYFRASATLLMRIAAALAATFGILVFSIDWSRIVGISPEQSAPVSTAFAVLAGAVVAGTYLNLGYKYFLGIGRADHAYRWQAVGQILALVVVVIASKLGTGLAGLTAAALLPPLAAATTCFVQAHWKTRQASALSAPEQRTARRTMLTEGFMFFAMQLATALAFWADTMIIASTSGPEEAGTYAVLQRIFAVIPLVLGLAWGPLWPMYRRMMAAGNMDWARRTQRKFLVGATIYSALAASLLAVVLPSVLDVLGLKPLRIPIELVIGFATWAVLESAGTAVGTFLNSASLIRMQLPFAMAFAVGTFASKLVLANIDHHSFMPMATCAWYLTVCVIPYLVFQKRITDSINASRL
jgi:O-antigen/teichoic acid export membrane protein